MFIKSLSKLKSGFTFGLALILVQSFLLINCRAIFGTELLNGVPAYEFWRTVMMVYLVMLAVMFAVPDMRSKLMDLSLTKGLLGLFVGLLISMGVFSVLGSFVLDKSLLSLYGVIGTGVFVNAIFIQAFIVGACENLIFTGFLADRVGVVIASVIFALFHWSVYFSAGGGGWLSTFVVFGLSFLFYWVYKRFGMPCSIGVHAGWNLFVTQAAMAMMATL